MVALSFRNHFFGNRTLSSDLEMSRSFEVEGDTPIEIMADSAIPRTNFRRSRSRALLLIGEEMTRLNGYWKNNGGTEFCYIKGSSSSICLYRSPSLGFALSSSPSSFVNWWVSVLDNCCSESDSGRHTGRGGEEEEAIRGRNNFVLLLLLRFLSDVTRMAEEREREREEERRKQRIYTGEEGEWSTN